MGRNYLFAVDIRMDRIDQHVQWMNLRNMNHSHQSPGICQWKERGNTIIVAAGCRSNRYVEEYDIYKNQWYHLPDLHEKTETYAALFTSNNILFCVTSRRQEISQPSVKRRRLNSSEQRNRSRQIVELYDPRDSKNEWIAVDTIEKYFNLPFDAKNINKFILSL